ncbi:MAG: tetratricopeptide repeat protein [Xanthomonadaceae bacterium]|nr:tetratricopeptide repeat protein [Xanthomonadaceae bacterium]
MKVLLIQTMVLASCLAAGCASVQPPPAPRVADATAQPPPVAMPASSPTRAARPAPLPAAARNLASQAERASRQGDHEVAAAYLERALRMAPNHPVLWQNLAVVRYRQHEYAKVEGLALKSNSLAGADNALRAENWRLIAEVRRLRGDRQGAERAYAEYRRLAAAARTH